MGHNPVKQLEQAVRLLESCREFSALVPEVRVNLVFAPEGAHQAEDVLGVDGRITVVAGMPKASGPLRQGSSDHMARLIIELRKYDETIRAGLNFRWHETILVFVQRYCVEHGLVVGCIDRTVEPTELIGKDKGSIPWKVKHLLGACGGKVPPVFYESRGWGKEPLFFLVGTDPVPLVHRAIEIARGFAARPAGR